MKFKLFLAGILLPLMVQAEELQEAPVKEVKPITNLGLIDFWRATAKDIDRSVKAGANINEVSPRFNATPLMRAASISAQTGDFEILDYLLQSKVKVNRRNSIGQTALMFALENKRQSPKVYDVIEKLLNAGADPSVADEDGRTALMYAIQNTPYPNVIGLLVSRGSELNYPDKYNKSPLMYAKKGEIFELLLNSGADINYKDEKGETVLLKMPAFARMLLTHGARHDVVNYYKETPLMLSAKLGLLDSCQALVSVGADVNARHELSQKTALFYAVENEKPKIVEFLLSAGAKIELRDKTGKTALDYANRNERKVIQKYIASKNVVREGKHPFTKEGVKKYLENNFYYNSPKNPKFMAYLAEISGIPQTRLNEILSSVYDEQNAIALVLSEMDKKSEE